MSHTLQMSHTLPIRFPARFVELLKLGAYTPICDKIQSHPDFSDLDITEIFKNIRFLTEHDLWISSWYADTLNTRISHECPHNLIWEEVNCSPDWTMTVRAKRNRRGITHSFDVSNFSDVEFKSDDLDFTYFYKGQKMFSIRTNSYRDSGWNMINFHFYVFNEGTFSLNPSGSMTKMSE
jgi:hypothetical protein